MKGGQKVIIEPHRHEGVFIARSKEVSAIEGMIVLRYNMDSMSS